MLDEFKVFAASLAEVFERPKKFYGQFGEDAVLQHLLHNRLLSSEPGFYIDIGAFSPKTFSNTYWFYRRGWRGINIDATPGSMRAFRRLRPRDINIESAISDQKEPVVFYQLGLRTVLNTVLRNVAQDWEKKLNRTPVTTELIPRTLNSILSQYQPENIDFLSVDVEGHDLNVLKSNDWDQFRPSIVIVEDHFAVAGRLEDSDVSLFLRSCGYEVCGLSGPSLFFKDTLK